MFHVETRESTESASQTPCYVGVDLGTSGVRATAIDAQGLPLAEASQPLPPPEQDGDGVWQDAELWWQAALACLSELAAMTQGHPWQALSIDGTSGSVLVTDAERVPQGPARMYSDTSQTRWQQAIAGIAPAGSPACGSGSALARALALQASHPQAAHLCSQADWIAARLGRRNGHSDENNCLKLGYDPLGRHWPDWLDHWPTLQRILPASVHQAGEPMFAMHAEIAEQLGLASPPAILAGTTDSLAAFLATGASQTGQAMTALGTSLVLKLVCAQPVNAAEYGVYSHPLLGHWLAGGASNCGAGILLKYFSSEELVTLSREIDPNTESPLDYYPLLHPGERFPVNDPDLQPRISPVPSDRVALLHGLLESLARIEYQGYRRLQEFGAPWPTEVFTTGGGSQNETWRAIRSRVLGVPVTVAPHTEASYGMARLALLKSAPISEQ